MNNWKLRKAFTGNNTSDVQTINGYIAAGEDNDFSVEVSPVGKEYPAPLVVPRTNLVPFSEQLESSAWYKTRCTIDDNSTTSPEGVVNASKMTSTDALESYIEDNLTTIGTKLSWSFFAKKGDLDYAHGLVWDNSANGCRQWFNLSTGAVGGTTTFGSTYSVESATIEDYGNGWYRCMMVVNLTAGTHGCRVNISSADALIGSPVNSYGYFYGLQAEEGSYATEYIPTNGAPVTRSWDSFSRVQNQVPGISNGTHTHTGAASGSGIAATTITGTGSGGKFKYEFDTLGKLTLIEAMTHENLLLQSNTFNTTWTTFDASVASGESGYDGSSDAWLLSKSDANGFIRQIVDVSTQAATFSFYAKAGTLDWVYVNTLSVTAYFYLSGSGSVGTVTGVLNVIDTNIESVGNGWYRISVSGLGFTQERIYPADDNEDRSGTSGSIYIQDAQLEQASQATGYIETTTAPVREGAGQGYRVDDKLSITTNEGHDIEFRLVEGSNAATVSVSMGAAKPNKPIPFPVTKMRVADSTDRQVLIMDERSRYVFPKPTPYLLDTYEGAAAAYSLRRLRSAYTGPAVRVRRASNNDELDIYFNRDGSLDTATLEAFCAGTDGFVKVWYDQGQEGNDATQTTTANQPKIYDSSTGVLTDANGKPAVYHDSGNKYLISSTPSGFSGKSQSAFVTGNPYAPTGIDFYFYIGDASPSTGATRALTQEPYLRFTTTVQDYDSYREDNVHHLYSMVCPGTVTTIDDYDLYRNGSLLTPDSLSGGAVNDVGTGLLHIGNNNSAVRPFYGLLQELVFYNSDQSANRQGIEDNINEHYGIYEFSGLLDDYSGAAAAYSLRRLSSTYTGPAIRVVKHDVGYPEIDIPFEDDGTLSVVLLEAFADGYDATVKVWYDQSGGSNDAEQSTLASQPKIVDAGTVIYENGLPAVEFDGSATYLFGANKTTIDNTAIFSVIKSDSNTQDSVFIQTTFTTGNFVTLGLGGIGSGNAIGSRLAVGGTVVSQVGDSTFTSTDQTLISYLADNATSQMFIDGTAETDVVGSRNNYAVTTIGARGDGLNNFNGKMQEVIFYDSDETSNRTGIETNINDFYDIYS